MERTSTDGRVVAALCYRCRDGRPELLLVKTKGGAKWTFPKGHVEAREAPSAAAAREALEEAGAVGVVADEPASSYVYPTGSDRGGERQVEVYLLKVVSQSAPERGEESREPTWLDLDAAKEKLAEGGREPRYADEHRRVIDEAGAQMAADCGSGHP